MFLKHLINYNIPNSLTTLRF